MCAKWWWFKFVRWDVGDKGSWVEADVFIKLFPIALLFGLDHVLLLLL